MFIRFLVPTGMVVVGSRPCYSQVKSVVRGPASRQWLYVAMPMWQSVDIKLLFIMPDQKYVHRRVGAWPNANATSCSASQVLCHIL